MTSSRLWRTHREKKRRAELPAAAHVQEDAALIDCYRAVFSGEKGKVVLADILRSAGMASRTWAPGVTPEEGLWREGRRSLALEIIEMVNRDPNALLEMLATGEVADLTAEGTE